MMLASSAYLATAASTRSLRAAFTDWEVCTNKFKEEILETRKSTLPGGEVAMLSKQKTWYVPLIAIDKSMVWTSNDDQLSRARLLAVLATFRSDWLLTAPIASCGLGLSNEAVRVAIGLRLGLKLCAPHQCQCGETTDPRGHHGLVCKQSVARASRHFAMNDIIRRSFLRADILSSKEPPGLLRTDGKRPDGATPVPWSKGKYTTWDFTSIHTCAASYIPLTSATAGSAAELAASRKVTKYADFPATHNFVPIAIESLGPVNTAGLEFIKELGQRITVATGDPMETVHVCSSAFQSVHSGIMQ